VRGGHGIKVAMEAVSQGRTKTVPTGDKRMETGVPEESGEVKVMKRGAKVNKCEVLMANVFICSSFLNFIYFPSA
jgi:hypothetical protein